MDENENRLTDHNYDGIQEYDNALPNWWLATFIGTVIFGSIYWLHYSFGGGPTLQDEFKQEMEQIEHAQSASQNGVHAHNHGTDESEEELVKKLNSAGVLASGKAVFDSKCASCHGDKLQGLIGPNLVDEYWIHGKGRITDIMSVVSQGVPEKGMPMWSSMLKEEEIESVSVFIKSHQGDKPASPKAPQGEKVANN